MGFWADEVLRARDATDGSTGKYGLQDQRAPMAARDQALGWLADALGWLAGMALQWVQCRTTSLRSVETPPT